MNKVASEHAVVESETVTIRARMASGASRERSGEALVLEEVYSGRT
jgi:hypothetical protein